MHLSSVNKQSSAQSLARKLALLYAITSFSVLIVASGVLYWSVSDHLQREHQNLLFAKVSELRRYFKSSSAISERLFELINNEHQHSHLPHTSAIHPNQPHAIFVRIFDNQGGLLIQSNAIQSLPQLDGLSEPDKQNAEGIQYNKIKNDKGQLFLLGSAWATTNDKALSGRLFLQVVLKLTADDTLLLEFQKTLSAVLIFGVLASALTGFWVTRWGLRPLRQMTQAIQNINVQHLDERVDSQQWPKEIALLAKAFDEMLARLHGSFAQLSQFSADLAHELRTPVNNLMGEAEVALSRDRDVEEYRRVLESNMEECTRIARMIDELLFLAKAEDPKMEISCSWLQTEIEFEAIKDFYDNLAAEQQIEIHCQSNQVQLYADPRLVRRVLSNLISNAIRYTSDWGTITLSASNLPDNAMKICVTDTGEGIQEELLPHIFDRFFRVDKSRYHNAQGSGLGLAIVKSIMELHNGQVSVTSHLHQGTKVELIFPNSQK